MNYKCIFIYFTLFQNTDDDYSNYNKNDDEEEEDVEHINFGNGYQAEEATTTPRTAATSSLTKMKWEYYGTRERVEESRQKHLYHDKPNCKLTIKH